MRYCVIPPKQSGEFVAAMENVVETYELPYDPHVPVVVMDDQPVQSFTKFGDRFRRRGTMPDGSITNMHGPALQTFLCWLDRLGPASCCRS